MFHSFTALKNEILLNLLFNGRSVSFPFSRNSFDLFIVKKKTCILRENGITSEVIDYRLSNLDLLS